MATEPSKTFESSHACIGKLLTRHYFHLDSNKITSRNQGLAYATLIRGRMGPTPKKVNHLSDLLNTARVEIDKLHATQDRQLQKLAVVHDNQHEILGKDVVTLQNEEKNLMIRHDALKVRLEKILENLLRRIEKNVTPDAAAALSQDIRNELAERSREVIHSAEQIKLFETKVNRIEDKITLLTESAQNDLPESHRPIQRRISAQPSPDASM